MSDTLRFFVVLVMGIGIGVILMMVAITFAEHRTEENE